MNPKGQGATEYLIILAVIIVIALVVVGVMGWFPGLGGGITEQASKAYWSGTSPMALTNWSITSVNSQFTVQNNSVDRLTLTEITVDGAALGIADVNINAGGTTTPAVSVVKTCTSGQSFSYDVTLTYSVAGGISGITQTGDKPVVGTCP